MVDWDQIWEFHAPFHKNGISNIPLKNGKTLQLKPGAGFGDLSHPTTQLCLDMLSDASPREICIDIGTGTGILAIAAALFGAKKVYAYEIDPDAICHAKENIALNKLTQVITLNPPTPPTSFDLVIINMIASEQKIALEALPFLEDHPHTRIVSGILSAKEQDYFDEFGLTPPAKRKTLGEWACYSFKAAK